MIGYVTLGTNDLERARAFYDTVLGVWGAKRGWDGDNFTAWGVSPTTPAVGVITPFNGQPATAGNGTMISLVADSRAKVDALYAAALANGGTDEGAPGIRGGEGSTFYAAYFRDLDGNKLAAFCMGAE